jgi:hypothetical protein
MKRQRRFLIATTLSLPLVLGVLGDLIAILMGERCPEFLSMGMLFWLLWILTLPWGALSLIVVSTSVLVSWMQKGKSGFEKAGLAFYTVAVLVHVGIVIWWYATGQVWEL